MIVIFFLWYKQNNINLFLIIGKYILQIKFLIQGYYYKVLVCVGFYIFVYNFYMFGRGGFVRF